jgi:heme-degrading monooxygenase HmoA
MSIEVLVKRTVPEDRVKDFLPLLIHLRKLAMDQPGYISGATLKRRDKPGEYLVMSSWHFYQDWEKWEASQERKVHRLRNSQERLV